MLRNFLVGMATLAVAAVAHAQVPAAQADCDVDCMLDTVWTLGEQLEDRKRDRINTLILETAALTQDASLITVWETRIGKVAETPEPYESYSLNKVARFIEAEGWDTFFSRARVRAFPLNSGRPEMMAAAAQHIADEATAMRIYTLMEALGNQDVSQAAFERASFGHVLAEAAMRRCDLPAFDRALQMTDAPDSIRYAFWRARIVGNPGQLSARIKAEFDPDNSAVLRQSLDGYGEILKRGVCETPAK